MVLDLEPLMSANQLKITFLKSLLHAGKPYISVSYDDDFDAVRLMWDKTKDIIVHYLNNDHVAVLYRSADNEIIGFQLEDFQYSFMPAHSELEGLYRITLPDPTVEDIGILVTAITKENLSEVPELETTLITA